MSRKKFARYKSASHDRPHGALSRGSARGGLLESALTSPDFESRKQALPKQRSTLY
jgi:hypothetical protein